MFLWNNQSLVRPSPGYLQTLWRVINTRNLLIQGTGVSARMDVYIPHNRGNNMETKNKNKKVVEKAEAVSDSGTASQKTGAVAPTEPRVVLERVCVSESEDTPQAVAAGSSKFWGKRPRACELGAGLAGLSSSEENLPAPKVPTARRGRGRGSNNDIRGRFLKRPDTPMVSDSDRVSPAVSVEDLGGVTVALVGTKAEANAAKRAQSRAVASDEVAEMARQARERRSAHAANGESLTAEALSRQVMDGVDIVLKVATKSGNLKGSFTRALKEAAEGIREAVEVLHNHTTSEETARLWMENSRLRSELEDLKRQFAALQSGGQQQAAPSSAPAVAVPPSQSLSDYDIERVARICMVQCGAMVSARLETVESRLPPAEILRPPLAADRRRMEESSRTKPVQVAQKPAEGGKKSAAGSGRPVSGQGASAPLVRTSQPPVTASPTHVVVGGEGRRKKRAAGATAPITSQAAAVPATAPPTQEAWTTVVKRGRKKRAPQPTPPQVPTRPEGTRLPRVTTPRSEAVVITLQPEAVNRGVTYKSVLAEMKQKLQFSEFGTPAGFVFRTAATGAKMLQVSGAARQERADKLAAKLREVLKPEDARVSRPTVTAELRVEGLDDSVTPEEVVAAIARNGGCPPDNVVAGEIRSGVDGLGTVWVRCPVAAANKAADGGRLLVGWVSARVKLLPKRAVQCFRCLEKGHVRAQCTAQIDRSELCFRCGRPGHRAAQCSGAPNCSLCAAAGKRSEHRLGGKACKAPKSKKKRSRAVGETAPLPQPDSQPREGGAEEMECH